MENEKKKESWEYEAEYKAKGEELAKDLENMVNCCPYGRHGAIAFVRYLTYNTHPYLRQELFKVALGFIREMADSKQHDGRDEASARTARYIVDKLDAAWYDEKECVMAARKID